MEIIEFLAIMLVAAAIVAWYVVNENQNADGTAGFLRLRVSGQKSTSVKAGDRLRYHARDRHRASYREAGERKTAYRKSGDSVLDNSSQGQTPGEDQAGEAHDETERLVKKYRRQDDVRYRIKDKAARFNEKSDKRP